MLHDPYRLTPHTIKAPTPTATATTPVNAIKDHCTEPLASRPAADEEDFALADEVELEEVPEDEDEDAAAFSGPRTPPCT